MARISNADLSRLMSTEHVNQDDYTELHGGFERTPKHRKSSAHGRESYEWSMYNDSRKRELDSQRETARKELLNPKAMEDDYLARKAVEVIKLEQEVQVTFWGKLLAWFQS